MMINRRNFLRSMAAALGGLTLIGTLPEGLLADSPVPKFRTINIWFGDELMESVQVPFVPMSEFSMDGVISKELEETMWFHRLENIDPWYAAAAPTVVGPVENFEYNKRYFEYKKRWSKTG